MNTKTIFALVFMIGTSFLTPLAAQSEQDLLPLGKSKYKFKIGKVEQGQIVQTAGGQAVTIDDIIKKHRDTDVFILGESHLSNECHTFQRDFIEALYKQNPKVVVGFEFFQRDDDAALEEWRQGKIKDEELLEKTGWYERTSYNYRFTRIVLDVIEKYKIKVIGLNVPRTILRQVSRKGFSSLSKEEKALFPTINIDNPEHEYFIKYVFGTFAVQVPAWFKNIYAAQKCWDVIMAESMRRLLSTRAYKGYRGVIIAGSNHVAYGLGIPFRYRKADKKIKITTIVPVHLPEEEEAEGENPHPMMAAMGGANKPSSIFSRGIADYVFAIPQEKNLPFPMLGVKADFKDGKMVVTDVTEESIAAEQGLTKGDVVESLDGVAITSKAQFRSLLAAKNWGDEVTIKVIKKIGLNKKEDHKKKENPPHGEAKKESD